MIEVGDAFTQSRDYSESTSRCTLQQLVLFPATFLIMSSQCYKWRSLKRSSDAYGGKLITLYYDQLPDTGRLIIIQYAGYIEQTAMYSAANCMYSHLDLR